MDCFLFTDLILVCKAPKRMDKFKIIRPPMRLDQLVVSELKDKGGSPHPPRTASSPPPLPPPSFTPQGLNLPVFTSLTYASVSCLLKLYNRLQWFLLHASMLQERWECLLYIIRHIIHNKTVSPNSNKQKGFKRYRQISLLVDTDKLVFWLLVACDGTEIYMF